MDVKEINKCVTEVLKQAADTVSARAEDYDTACENSFPVIAELWNARAGSSLYAPSDVAEMLALMKIGRAQNRKLRLDSYLDACAYLAFAFALRLNENSEGDNHENP